MHRFFAQRTDEKTAVLPPDEARHALTVLRLKPGDTVQAVVEGALYGARILDAAEETRVELLEELPSPEPLTHVTLYQGLPKGDKMDYIAQKCTEAGVYAISPVQMPRCVAKTDARDGEKKAERWRRIALEAAKQSGRTRAPEIIAPISQRDMLNGLKNHGLILVPWEDAHGVSVKDALKMSAASDIAVVIGPEGGMGDDEVMALKAAGAVPVTLGRRIFRTETAGLAALMMILYEKGDYEG